MVTARGRYENSAEYGYYSDDPEVVDVPQSNRFSKILGAITILIAASFFVNSTLAANINLTGTNSVEFGQGVQLTTACSGNVSLTIQPASSFSNSAGGGAYALASIKVTNIPDSCFGSDFILNAYGETSTAPLPLFNSTSTDAVIYNNAGTFQPGMGSTGMSVASASGQFTATFTVPVSLSKSIYRITIQSGPHATLSCALGGTCVVGDTGPGGGKIFYVSAGGFACGITRSATCHYLELAPTNWNGGSDPTRSWAQSTPVDYTTTTLLLNQSLGYGALNTKAIIDQGNSNTATSAAALAASYSVVVNGTTVNDWFLPAENDWYEVWNQRTVIGFTATGGNYWSSSSVAQTNGRYFIFSGTGFGGASGMPKGTSNGMYVRPARAF
jgi:hypothetical protein